MKIYLCDFCGEETPRGTNEEFRAVSIEANLSKRWQIEGFDRARHARVQIHIGIDNVNPEPEHDGHNLCDQCRARLLRAVLEMIEERDA